MELQYLDCKDKTILKKKFAEKYRLLTPRQQEIYTVYCNRIFGENDKSILFNHWNSIFPDGILSSLSQYFSDDERAVLSALLGEKNLQPFLNMMDNLLDYQYEIGWYRRSMRTRQYSFHARSAMELLTDFIIYANASISPIDMIKLKHCNIDKDKFALEDYIYLKNSNVYTMTALINANNTQFISFLEDIILGDNNTAFLSYEIINAIVKSNNTNLHKLLGDLLYAGRLQEGLRQAITENMDAGTPEAFFTLFNVIKENDLIRFSSVKRALATCTGLVDEINSDKITQKEITCLEDFLTDEKIRQKALSSQNPVEIYLALWSYAFYEIDTTKPLAFDLIMNGRKHQKLVAAYFLNVANAQNIIYDLRYHFITKDLPTENDCALIAVLFRTLPSAYWYTYSSRQQNHYLNNHLAKLSTKDLTHYYYKLKELSLLIKKQKVFSPCVFPWHSEYLNASDIVSFMVEIVNRLHEDTVLDDFCDILLKYSDSYYLNEYIKKLYSKPKNELQRQFLINSMSKCTAGYDILQTISLSSDNYENIAQLLKYKSSHLRQKAIKLLLQQDDAGLKRTAGILLNSRNKNMRSAGLDILLQIQKNFSTELFSETKEFVNFITNPTEGEKILIEEINKMKTAAISAEKIPLVHLPLPPKDPTLSFAAIYPLSQQQIIDIIDKFNTFYDKHGNLSYPHYNTEYLLADKFEYVYSPEQKTANPARLYSFPYPELWQDFYQNHIKNEIILYELYIFLNVAQDISIFKYVSQQIFNEASAKPFNFNTELKQKLKSFKHISKITLIVELLSEYYVSQKYRLKTARFFALRYLKIFDINTSVQTLKTQYSSNTTYYFIEKSVLADRVIRIPLCIYAVDEIDFKDNFAIYYNIYQMYNYKIIMPVFNLVRAAQLKLISLEELYSNILEDFEDNRIRGYFIKTRLGRRLEDLSDFYLHTENKNNYPLFDDKDFCNFGHAVTDTIIAQILSVELKRGDLPTKYTDSISGIKRIYGYKYFVDILAALSNEKLKNVCYLYENDKRSVLSYLLYVCRPDKNDTVEKLKAYLQERKIGINRLVEAVMLSPSWIPLVDKILKWKGFISGCYYFQAHMRYANEKMASTFAKYTPISLEDLQDGAFDLNWFKTCYKQLGKERFSILYDACKYISEGNAHTRARKYADAVTGLLNADEVKAQIKEKRNKDLLMAYGLIPLSKSGRITKTAEKEMLGRYKFIQQFLKESKKFGAQRRTSEALACKIALNNLARNAKFDDAMRFTLNMETNLIKEKLPLFTPVKIDNISLYLKIDELGKTSIICEKNGKTLKSVPKKLKNNPHYLSLKKAKTEFTDQFSRARATFEQAMENSTVFFAQEISMLFTNPVIRPLLMNLIFIAKKDTGYFKDNTLISSTGKVTQLDDKTPLRIAHAFDLYSLNVWHEYQKDLFDRQIKQPFKQVFRELYVKTAEELQQFKTRRYDGNQIQPQKAYALLKTRNWLADYDYGLQKIYYNENIIATIYAMCDWFSPADIEAPTIEYVAFYDRRTFKNLPINDIPDIIFSEVMRDIDLVVSVAHVGGVDPEASHSTIEMRRAIIEFTLPLFKLHNVDFNGNFALIKGNLADYSVHLGSGIIHQQGGTQISVLPVHSQHRGRLFLPFVDDDPKTAEVLTKILFFAEDNKIKDPFILNQISVHK